MKNKQKLSGGKYTGNHPSNIPAAGLLCASIHDMSLVSKISSGFMKGGLRPVAGNKRVKLKIVDYYILMTVRDNTAKQEVAIYSNGGKENLPILKKQIEMKAKELGLKVT